MPNKPHFSFFSYSSNSSRLTPKIDSVFPAIDPRRTGYRKETESLNRIAYAVNFPPVILAIRSIAADTFSRELKALRRKYPSPQRPKPEPGVPTT